jgi:hypothetical protein
MRGSFTEHHVEWYAALADVVETTVDSYRAACSDCDDDCDRLSAYRMNGKPVNPRSGRSVLLGEKLTDADL